MRRPLRFAREPVSKASVWPKENCDCRSVPHSSHVHLSSGCENPMVRLNSITELRRPKETAEFVDSLHPSEQREWLEDPARDHRSEVVSDCFPKLRDIS